MALIIEDGSIVPGANSYVTVSEISAYATQRGFSITRNIDTIETAAILAMDYMQSKSYIGDLVDGFDSENGQQPLKWPRQNITDVLKTTIPTDIKSAQIELSIASFTQSLISSSTPVSITSEQIGELKTDYSGTGLRSSFTSARVNILLSKYISTYGLIRV
jgi:hypothetical protein